MRADARVGVTRVGVDLMLGAREAGATRLGGCSVPGAPGETGSVLGADAVLGEKRPGYARPAGLQL